MLERFLQVTRAEAIIPEGDWLTPVALRSVGPLRVFSVYPHDSMKDPALVNIFYGEDGRTKPFKVNSDQDDRLALLAPDNGPRDPEETPARVDDVDPRLPCASDRFAG
jgi:hypothetical protein